MVNIGVLKTLIGRKIPCPKNYVLTAMVLFIWLLAPSLVAEGATSLNQDNPLVVQIFAGREQFAGSLADQLNAGPTYGLCVAFEPWSFLGIEMGYSGSVTQLKSSPQGSLDLNRDGLYLAITPGFTFSVTKNLSLKPYLLGGIGLDSFSVHDSAPAAGFTAETDGSLPFGGGLELRMQPVVLNARFNAVYEFGPAFNPFDPEPIHFQGMVSFGTAFDPFAARTKGAAPDSGSASSTDARAQDQPWIVEIFGGVEGFSGSLASKFNVGPSYALAVSYERWQFLGIETGYSGSVLRLKSSPPGNTDVDRDAAYLAITPGFTFALNRANSIHLKPYLLTGIGLDAFTAHDNGPTAGYTNQNDGFVPFGVGLELRLDRVELNARFYGSYEFGAPFNTFDPNPLRYQGMFGLGAAF